MTEAALTNTYREALAVSSAAGDAFALTRNAYRAGTCSDADFLAAKAIADEAERTFDAAFKAEGGIEADCLHEDCREALIHEMNRVGADAAESLCLEEENADNELSFQGELRMEAGR